MSLTSNHPASSESLQAHITLLETDPKSQLALLQGLEYLVNISYVENLEVSGYHPALTVVRREGGVELY